MKLRYNRQITSRERNKTRMIAAALILWERGGEKAVTARAVGAMCGVTGQMVHKVFKTAEGMEGLRTAAAKTAIRCRYQPVIDHLITSGHYLAPRSDETTQRQDSKTL